jgi:RNA polymerase sigma-70 factor (ECF subfamily)
MFTQAVSASRIVHSSTDKARQDAAAGEPNTSDAALVERVGFGDKAAMAALYARHSLRIYRFILRLTGDATVAEDVLSEVFLDVWRSAARFKRESQVSTWLLAIARHKALSACRRRLNEPLEEQAAAAVKDPADDPEQATIEIDRGTVIRQCLMRLSPAHREVLDLVYYHDKSVDEVARILDASPNTIKTRMFYGRTKMMELLKQAGIDGL